MPAQLSRKERLLRQIRGQEVDLIPSLGGWIGGVRNLALGVDGLIQLVIPRELEQLRTGYVLESRFERVEPEDLVKKPTPCQTARRRSSKPSTPLPRSAATATSSSRLSKTGRASCPSPTLGRSAATSPSTPSSATWPSSRPAPCILRQWASCGGPRACTRGSEPES